MCIRDRYQRRVRDLKPIIMAFKLQQPLSRTLCTMAEEATAKAPEVYSKAISVLHWAAAPAMIGCIGCVLKCQQVPKEEKGPWMFRHKSLGLLTGLVVAPRLITKLMSKSPGPLPGASFIEELGAKASHYGLYLSLIHI
eukprot:TRINITY_DN17719_c0_g1_i8.p3 TRINITY_DN17719_c0_g1~~TRINITY_DN17719_c0_g1_i8.p3  ORF type:complete len:139 (-),score=44.95 TRINITY_DN17719_c0_g1_i8:124-540(-)